MIIQLFYFLCTRFSCISSGIGLHMEARGRNDHTLAPYIPTFSFTYSTLAGVIHKEMMMECLGWCVGREPEI